MSNLVSPKIAALRQKLRQAEHGGQYFSSDDVAGFLRELTTISDGVKALEDQIAASRRPVTPAPRPPAPQRMNHALRLPIGTLFFEPAEGARI